MIHLILLGGGLAVAGLKTFRKHQQDLQTADTEMAVTEPPPDEADELQAREKEVDHYMKVAGVAMGTAAIGEFLYPPLLLLTLPLILYTALPVFQAAFESLFIERKVRANIIDSVSIAGMLSGKYFFGSAIASVLYFTAQKMLIKTEDSSKKQLVNIFGEQPRSVWLFKDGVELEIPFEEVKKDDVIMVYAGEVMPIDGIILHGTATIDQHMLTGESQPVEKAPGDAVLAATIVIAGKIQVQVEKAGRETVAAGIGEILRNTADFRATIESRAVNMADQLATPTLALSGVAFFALGPISAVAVTCCNFSEVVRIASPIGVLNYLKLASQQGILIKDGRSLELLEAIDTVVFDKTGTLTLEQPHVRDIHSWDGFNGSHVLQLAAAAEYRQNHPIAKAILQAAHAQGVKIPEMDESRYEIGYGIKVRVAGQTVRVGSARFLEMEGLTLPDSAATLQAYCHDNGFSLVFVGVDDQVAGALELHATLRPEAARVVQALHGRGKDVYIISGDHERPTRKMAEELGIPHYFADTLPEDKAKHISRLQAEGKSVCFIGDGINDTIAMKKAQVSISLSGATSAATDTAGIILMDKTLNSLPELFDLAKGLDTNLKTGFGAALIPGAAGLGGVFLLHFGIYNTIGLYILSLTTGVANASLPLLGARKKEKEGTTASAHEGQE